MAQAGQSHDVTIANSDGSTNKRGFMLMRKNGRRSFVVGDYRTILPRQLTMGELTDAEFPPEVELIWSQKNWQAGMGLVNHHVGNGEFGIAQGTKIDTTPSSGVIRLAGDLIAATVDSNPNEYVPSGFAVVGTEAWAFVGRDVYSWDYTNKNWDIGTEPLAATIVRRNGVPYNGNVVVASWADDVGSGGSYTGSDLPTIYIYKADSDANWIKSTLATTNFFKYFAMADTKIWGGYTATRTSSSTLYDDINSSTTSVPVARAHSYAVGDIIELNTEMMLITVVAVDGWAPGVDTFTVVRGYRGTAAVSHIATTTAYEISAQVHQVRSSTDPTNSGSWSGATSIGDSSSEITALVTYYSGTAELLLVCKQDGIWTLNAAGTLTLLYDISMNRHGNNFRGAFSWDGNRRVILPLGSGGMLELNAGTIRDISFKAVMPDQTHLHGPIVAGAGTETRVFVLVHDSTNTKYHLMMGEIVSIGGTSDYRWHHVGAVSYTTGTDALHAAVLAEGVPSGAVTHHRVLVGVESTGSNLLPYYYPIDTADTEFVFTNDTDAVAITVASDNDLPRVNKHYTKIDFTTANLGSGGTDHYIEVKYRTDGGSWTYVTGVQASSKLTTTPQTLTFQNNVTGKKIELQFLVYRGTTTTTSPQILDWSVRAQLRPAALKFIPLSLYLSDDQYLLNGARGGAPTNDITQLRTWNGQADAVKVVTPDGTTYTGVFIPGSMKITELAKVHKRRAEYQVDLLLVEA